jgi:hypothetical protein
VVAGKEGESKIFWFPKNLIKSCWQTQNQNKGKVNSALPLLFISFGKHQLPGQPAIADK